MVSANSTEFEIQRELADELNALGVLFTASVAGIKMPPRTMAKLKASGYKVGTPDLDIFEPRGKYCGLFIELKTLTGVASDDQNEFIDNLQKRGYKAEICKGYDAAKSVIDNYLQRGI